MLSKQVKVREEKREMVGEKWRMNSAAGHSLLIIYSSGYTSILYRIQVVLLYSSYSTLSPNTPCSACVTL